MDSIWERRFIMDLLKMIGLPGLVILGWIYAICANAAAASNVSLWVAILCTSILASTVMTQKNSSNILGALQQECSQSHLLLMNSLDEITQLQTGLVRELTEVQKLMDGRLSLAQTKLILNPIIAAMQWDAFGIIIKFLGGTSRLVSSDNIIDILNTTMHNSFSKFSPYNSFFEDMTAKAILLQATRNVVERVFEKEVQVDRLSVEQLRLCMTIIEQEFGACLNQLHEHIRTNLRAPSLAVPTTRPVNSKDASITGGE